MRLDRDKAFFTDSRLYRQAEEIADYLLLNLQVPVPLADAVFCLHKDGQGLGFRKPSEVFAELMLQEAVTPPA